MDDSFGVGSMQAVGDLGGHLQKRVQLHGAASDGVLQGIPFQILHRDERSIVFFANLVNGAMFG